MAVSHNPSVFFSPSMSHFHARMSITLINDHTHQPQSASFVKIDVGVMKSWSSGSKATPSTLCQKCLKKGHYSYECTAAQQSRPYISRPSRSQQFSNPKLAPKISDKGVKPPEDLLKPVSSAKEKKSDDAVVLNERKQRPRSLSRSSSDSVSTISTNESRSPRRNDRQRQRYRSRSYSNDGRGEDYRRNNASRDDSYRRKDDDSQRQSRQPASTQFNNERGVTRSETPTDRQGDRHTKKRSRSRSPYHSRTSHNTGDDRVYRTRERSLSPYSRRRAMANDP